MTTGNLFFGVFIFHSRSSEPKWTLRPLGKSFFFTFSLKKQEGRFPYLSYIKQKKRDYNGCTYTQIQPLFKLFRLTHSQYYVTLIQHDSVHHDSNLRRTVESLFVINDHAPLDSTQGQCAASQLKESRHCAYLLQHWKEAENVDSGIFNYFFNNSSARTGQRIFKV